MIISMLDSIQIMEHSVQTSFGDSHVTYGGVERRLPSHGTIQGNVTLPPIWATISTVLFLALNEQNYGGAFHAPITILLISLLGFENVDDTGLLKTQHHRDETIVEIVNKL